MIFTESQPPANPDALLEETIVHRLKPWEVLFYNRCKVEFRCTFRLLSSYWTTDESMQKLFANGCGIIYEKVGTWLASKHPQLQLTGALAVANFARNGKVVYSLPIKVTRIAGIVCFLLERAILLDFMAHSLSHSLTHTFAFLYHGDVCLSLNYRC